MSGDDDDALLVAFIDQELDESARGALAARLAADADLRARLARLREGGRAFAPAFQGMLDAAPIERLKASLASINAGELAAQPARRSPGARIGRLAAAAALMLFCAGIVADRVWPRAPPHPLQTAGPVSDRDEDWRQAVVEYMNLYTVDTFSSVAASPDAGLSLVGAKLGLDLTPERVALAKLQFKGAQIFDFHGAPLGQLGYVDAASGPVLFCIADNGEPDAGMKAETLGGFATASWSRASRGYLLVGRLPVDEMALLADSLERRF